MYSPCPCAKPEFIKNFRSFFLFVSVSYFPLSFSGRRQVKPQIKLVRVQTWTKSIMDDISKSINSLYLETSWLAMVIVRAAHKYSGVPCRNMI